MSLRLSDHFQLDKSQAELDFVDIPLMSDLPLFVDPYALSLEHDEWFIACNNLVVDFFQFVIDNIRSGNTIPAGRLLLHLQEPNDTHLGLSRGRPQGRGIGSDQAGQIYRRLAESEAVQTGRLQDLADAELVIPGIGSDKISDITTNIIREQLVKYTQSQCDLLRIPVRRVSAGWYWKPERRHWVSAYAELPVYRNRRILLVPKAAVRYRLSVDHQEYYRHFVLEFLRAEHLEASSALVTTLKNGKQKVYKKKLEEVYPLSKDFLFRFTQQHPEVLEQYKDSLPEKSQLLDNEHIEEAQDAPRNLKIEEEIEKLNSIPSGNAHASEYHNFILGALTTIFYSSLVRPQKEREIDEGRKRIDIVFTNRAQKGFFYSLNLIHRVRCPYVSFECKNYSEDPTNPELDQLAGRFSPNRGNFGIVVCRSVTDKNLMLRRCKDVLHADRGFVLVLDDHDIGMLLHFRAIGHDHQIEEFLDQSFEKLIM